MAPSPSTLAPPLLAYQPLSTLYQIYRLVLLLVRLPFWATRALFPPLRPHPTWTFRQAVMARIIGHFVTTNSTLALTKALSLRPGREGARWAVVEPPSPLDDGGLDYYVGPLTSARGRIRPTTIGGTWYGVDAAPSRDEARGWTRVALHIHGGAFVMMDGRQATLGYMGGLLAGPAGFEAVFMPQYRLAGYGGRDPFPAALQDCLTAYLYLVRTLGIPPGNITLSGDSAGGNLAIALWRYLERFGGGGEGGAKEEAAGGDDNHKGRRSPVLPGPPGRIVLLSPWVRPSAGLHTDYERWALARTDYLKGTFLRWGADAYVRQSADLDDAGAEWVDALGHPFATGVPAFLTFGGRELLSVDCAAWADEMRRENDGENNNNNKKKSGGGGGITRGKGRRLEVNVEEGAPHDCLLVADDSGWEENAEDVARKIRKFVEET